MAGGVLLDLVLGLSLRTALDLELRQPAALAECRVAPFSTYASSVACAHSRRVENAMTDAAGRGRAAFDHVPLASADPALTRMTSLEQAAGWSETPVTGVTQDATRRVEMSELLC